MYYVYLFDVFKDQNDGVLRVSFVSTTLIYGHL